MVLGYEKWFPSGALQYGDPTSVGSEGLRRVISMDKKPLLSLGISVYHMYYIIICISSYINYISIKTCLHVSAIKASNAKSNLWYILYTGVVVVNNVSIA